ncbi:MAG: hypothetical protein O2999_14995, partial [Nitrospirae bacterium]|nr:hypothetical protein [Nitrospirota bacterium]
MSWGKISAALKYLKVNTGALAYRKIHLLEVEARDLGREVALGSSYFSGIRKDKRWKGAPGKVPVVDIIKWEQKDYTQIIDVDSKLTCPVYVAHEVSGFLSSA